MYLLNRKKKKALEITMVSMCMSPLKLFTELDVDIIMPMENTIKVYFFF